MAFSKYLDCELCITDRDRARLSVGGREYSGHPALDEALGHQLRKAALDPTHYGTLAGPQIVEWGTPALFMRLREGPLTRYSLIQRDVEARTYSVHRLMQAVVRQTLDEADCRGWAERVVRTLNRTFPDPVVEFAGWPLCDRLLPHVAVAVQWVEEFSLKLEPTGRLFNMAASYLWYRARYAEAEPLFRRALEIREEILGKEHPDIAETLNNLAALYHAQGRYAEALPPYRRALEIREKALGKEHPFLADTLEDYAAHLRKMGRDEEAAQYDSRARRVRDRHARMQSEAIPAD